MNTIVVPVPTINVSKVDPVITVQICVLMKYLGLIAFIFFYFLSAIL